MEILKPGKRSNQDAVFRVVVEGRSYDLPWVKHTMIKDGVLHLSDTDLASADAAVTYVNQWEQAAWVMTAGEPEVVPGVTGVRTL